MNEEFQSPVLASITKCPSCGGMLEKGYVKSQAIYFDLERKRLILSPKYLLTRRFGWNIPTLPALRCVRCKIVVLDYVEG